MNDSDAGPANAPPSAGTNASCGIDSTTSTESSLDDRWARQVWSNGSYEDLAPKYLSMAGRLVERADVGADEDVLDIGCGTGSVAITAARRGADVTGIDVALAMLDGARENAETAGLDGIAFREGDATSLPFDADAFDATFSNLGHMYGDPPDAATEELLRVTRPGGRIGFTSWTPTSLYPSMAGAAVTALSPEDLPDFSAPPFLWGDAGIVRERLGDGVEDLEIETSTRRFPALSPEHFVEETATSSGMFVEVLGAATPDERAELRSRLVETVEPYFDDRSNAVELEYLLATATVARDE